MLRGGRGPPLEVDIGAHVMEDRGWREFSRALQGPLPGLRGVHDPGAPHVRINCCRGWGPQGPHVASGARLDFVIRH